MASGFSECGVFGNVVGWAASPNIYRLQDERHPLAKNAADFKDGMRQKGYFIAGRHNLSYAHSDSDIDRTLEIYDEVIGLLPQVMNKAS